MNLIGTPKRVVRFLLEVWKTHYPRIAYIAGWVGHQNLGDEILPVAMGELFHPFSLVHFGGERSVAYINSLTHSVLGGVLAGGTVINAGAESLTCMDKCTKLLPHSFVFGSGVQDPTFWQTAEDWQNNFLQWQDVLNRCEFVGVRGPISARLLANIGVTAEVVGDPALAFFDQRRELVHQDADVYLGLNIGQSYGKVWGSEDHIIREYVALARKARQTGWRVKWFVVWPEDLEVTKHVAEESGTTEDIFAEYNSAAGYLSKVRDMTIFVGMKLHAVILATCVSVPSLMVEYRPKCRDFMESINQEDASIRSDRFVGEETFETLQVWLEEIDHRRTGLWEEVRSLTTRQRQKAQEIVSRILENR